MTDRSAAEVRELAAARSKARAAHDWAEADRLRAEIETAGWRVVDHGTRFELRPAQPADVVEAGGRVRYGSSASVPSRLDDPPSAPVTLVVPVENDPDGLRGLLDGLRRWATTGLQVVVVANAPDASTTTALDGPAGPLIDLVGDALPEAVWTVERLRRAAALNAGLRRAGGEMVILADSSVELSGDAVAPLVAALDDPTVAVAGPWGSLSPDLRSWEDGPPGDVDAIEPTLMAFRRTDFRARGPINEHLRTERMIGRWWSLVLRDEGEGSRPRRAVRLTDLPVNRSEGPAQSAPGEERPDRDERRDHYRLLDRFGSRPDLLVGRQTTKEPPEGPLPA